VGRSSPVRERGDEQRAYLAYYWKGDPPNNSRMTGKEEGKYELMGENRGATSKGRAGLSKLLLAGECWKEGGGGGG